MQDGKSLSFRIFSLTAFAVRRRLVPCKIAFERFRDFSDVLYTYSAICPGWTNQGAASWMTHCDRRVICQKTCQNILKNQEQVRASLQGTDLRRTAEGNSGTKCRNSRGNPLQKIHQRNLIGYRNISQKSQFRHLITDRLTDFTALTKILSR